MPSAREWVWFQLIESHIQSEDDLKIFGYAIPVPMHRNKIYVMFETGEQEAKFISAANSIKN